MTLEEYLQKFYGLKGNLYRKRPVVDICDGDRYEYWFTQKGSEAYDRFVCSLAYLDELAQSEGISDPLDRDALNKLITIFDSFDATGPRNG
ncbi:MAG: hypothetical protein LUD27_02335 [Clostridia bacterium]|nr:hypothetical protein [Clostridia bacterium]